MAAYDVIVLGLGATGSAAACALARRGRSVLGIDRFDPPHAMGSSHGSTRVTRCAIGEGLHYSPLALRSHALWREIERETGTDLYTACGLLVLSSRGQHAYTHVPQFFENTLAAAKRCGIAHEMLDAAEIRARYPAYAVRNDEFAYFEPGGGFVRPEACIAAQLELARRYGADLHANERARSFDASATGVAVTTDRAMYHARELVVAAGPWLPTLIAPAVARPFGIYRQVLAWYDVGDAYPRFVPERFPVFIWQLAHRAQAIYGFPAIDGPAGGVKIATESYAATTTADAVARDVAPEELAALHDDYVAPYFPDVTPRVVRATTCLYTVTPDAGFVVDRHPDHPRVIVASPCSGHGFKHSPAIGEALADMVDGKPSLLDAARDTVSFARFRVAP